MAAVIVVIAMLATLVVAGIVINFVFRARAALLLAAGFPAFPRSPAVAR